MRRFLILGLLVLASSLAWSACTITTLTLPNGNVGVAYSQILNATGCGSGITLVWTLAPGNILPPGLTIHSDVNPVTGAGGISGTPTLAGTYPFVIDVSGNMGSAFQSYTVTIGTTALTFSTAALPKAIQGTSYSATLSATGGTGSYSWSVSAGTVPPPLTLSSAGVLSGGNPSTVGYSAFTAQVCDTSPTCITRQYFIGTFPQFDAYQGIVGTTPPWCIAQPYFQLGKTAANNRWTWCTPKTGSLPGNAMWMFNLQNIQNAWISKSPPGHGYSNYGCSNLDTNCTGWYTNTAKRIEAWGYNTVGEYSSSHLYDGSQMVTMPFVALGTLGAQAVTGNCSGTGIQLKDITAGLSSSPTNLASLLYCPGGGCPGTAPNQGALDLFDPEYRVCSKNAVLHANQTIPGSTAGSSYVLAISPAESDEFPYERAQGVYCGSGGGNPSPPCSYADTALLVLIANYCYGSTGTTSALTVGCTTGPNNHPLWSKYALACLDGTGIDIGYGANISYLEHVYGTIAALNAAWGTAYHGFCPSGAGWGTHPAGGGNLMDEDGSYVATFGVHPDLWTVSQLNFTAATIKTDLENFRRVYAKYTLWWFDYYVRNGQTGVPPDPNHLITGLNPVGGSDQSGTSGGDCTQNPNQYDLLGFKDAGLAFPPTSGPALIFVGCYEPQSSASPKTQVLQNIYSVTGLPVYPWVQMAAEQESYWVGCPNPPQNYATQNLRGAAYGTTISDLFNVTQGGDYPVVGIALWGGTDDNGSSNACAPANAQGGGAEAHNFGPISNNDNAYDGNSAITAVGVDAQGYTTGGEAGNWTNFVGPVTQAHLGVITSLALPLPGNGTQVNTPAGCTTNCTVVNNVTIH